MKKLNVVSIQTVSNRPTSKWRVEPKIRKTRVYINIDSKTMEAMIGVHPPYDTPEKKFDAEWKKFNRAEVKAMRSVYAEVMEELNTIGLKMSDKGSFSKYAGCTCPCSPGFISETMSNFSVSVGTTVVSGTRAALVVKIGDGAKVKPVKEISKSEQRRVDHQKLVKKPELVLTGEDGNAFSILGRARRALKDAGYSNEEVERYQVEVTEGDYNLLISVTMNWLDVS